MQIPLEVQRKLTERIGKMETDRHPWWAAWRELSDFFLPRRYPWLLSDKEHRSAAVRNRRLLTSTSTVALRTLATGMMNGITSPARPWFRLRITGLDESQVLDHEVEIWLQEATKRMLLLMAVSNFYQALGILYLEWCCFGTAAMSIYEDFDTVFRCYNFAVGEFYIDQDYHGRVNTFARKFRRTVGQTVEEFGLENCSEQVQTDYRAGGVRRSNPVNICHLIEQNEPTEGVTVNRSARWREFYWEAGTQRGQVLRIAPLNEFPSICPRWETYGSDVYGSSPCMDALPDVIQLQHLIKRRAQGLDKMIDPPLLINQMLANRPKSMLPGGETYVAGNDLQAGARPVYQIQVPFQELNQDIINTEIRIRQVLFNDLFRMISELDTVRSATEIDARREEKLVLLGPVLERFESEGLSPAIERIFRICERAGVFPPVPPALEGQDIQVQYVGILSDAQRAVGTVSIERWLQLIGNMAAIFPEDTLDVPNAEEIIREYAESIGVKSRLLNSRAETQARREGREEQRGTLEAAQVGSSIVDGAQQLSATDLGGGQNALQAIIGG